MFLTQKKVQQKIDQAVEAAVKAQAEELDRVRVWHWQEIEALKEQVEILRADAREREHALTREYDQKIREAVQAIEIPQAVSSVQTVEVKVVEPDPRVDALVPLTASAHKWIRELDDTVGYLLEAPASVVTVIQEAPAMYGVRAVAEQHGPVRPMGAR